jgi:hypothetical protein
MLVPRPAIWKIAWFADADTAAQVSKIFMHDGDVVVVKGSRRSDSKWW